MNIFSDSYVKSPKSELKYLLNFYRLLSLAHAVPCEPKIFNK